MKRSGIDGVLIDMLEASGMGHEIRRGSNHHKIYVRGRMVLVVPRVRGESGMRALLNARACLRRALRGAAS